MSAAKLHADLQFWGKVLLTAGVILWAMSLLMAARDIAEERRGLDIAGWLPALLSFIILGVVAAPTEFDSRGLTAGLVDSACRWSLGSVSISVLKGVSVTAR